MARRADPDFKTFGLDEPSPDPARAARNGAYTGACAIRHLPPGVTGEDLGRASRLHIAVGQVWHRGEQRVRIVRLSETTVTFRELTHGAGLRRDARARFLRMGFPERGFERGRHGARRDELDED